MPAPRWQPKGQVYTWRRQPLLQLDAISRRGTSHLHSPAAMSHRIQGDFPVNIHLSKRRGVRWRDEFGRYEGIASPAVDQTALQSNAPQLLIRPGIPLFLVDTLAPESSALYSSAR